MPLDRDAASIQDITISCRKIGEFIQGMDYKVFSEDERTQSAVILQILIIGEATKRLSADFLKKHPDIPWDKIARTRDILIHHYEGIDVEEIWRIARFDIPNLLSSIKSIENIP